MRKKINTNPFLQESRLETYLTIDKAFELSIKYCSNFNWEDLKKEIYWKKYN